MHVNNSNIREIPLVDNLPAVKKPITVNKTVPIVEEEVSFAMLYLFMYLIIIMQYSKTNIFLKISL